MWSWKVGVRHGALAALITFDLPNGRRVWTQVRINLNMEEIEEINEEHHEEEMRVLARGPKEMVDRRRRRARRTCIRFCEFVLAMLRCISDCRKKKVNKKRTFSVECFRSKWLVRVFVQINRGFGVLLGSSTYYFLLASFLPFESLPLLFRKVRTSLWVDILFYSKCTLWTTRNLKIDLWKD